MNANDKTSDRDVIGAHRAHLLATLLLGASSAIAIACSSAPSPEGVPEALGVTTEALGDELAAYAADCDTVMGATATVPAFDCDAQGIDLPVTVNGGAFDPSVAVCDAPDQFNGS